ncbi:hypothetical protein D3C86_1070810 [compost metagenome]
MQAIQGGHQLRMIGHFNHHRGRTEHFLLQHFIAIEQQADIGLEQLRLCLIALLRIAGQVLNPRMREEFLQALTIAAQGAGVEHGLRRLVAHQPGHLLHKGTERR